MVTERKAIYIFKGQQLIKGISMISLKVNNYQIKKILIHAGITINFCQIFCILQPILAVFKSKNISSTDLGQAGGNILKVRLNTR